MLKLSWLLFLLPYSLALALDVSNLANNKEVVSKELNETEILEAQSFAITHPLQPYMLKKKSLGILQASFDSFLSRDAHCDLGFKRLFQKNAIDGLLISRPSEFGLLARYLRNENIIDDVFYSILKKSDSLNTKMNGSLNQLALRPMNVYTRQNGEVEIESLYSAFKSWPDENTECSIGTYFRIANSLTAKNSNDLSRQLRRLNYIAYSEEVIDLKTYNALEVLRAEGALGWPVYIRRYLEIVTNAKDKMVIGKPESISTNKFSTNYASRKEKLTERGRLYKSFDSTQIIMLAQIIEKAGKRRDAENVILTFQFSVDPQDQENYVLSPMEKYRVSIKMLRNDMAALMRSDNFKGTAVEFEDLISAAFETGLIKSDQLDHILKFEELWNPKTPKWKTYTDFAFSLAGTSSFYLPPPFNVIGAIALVFTQIKLVNKKKNPNPEDSWNIIL